MKKYIVSFIILTAALIFMGCEKDYENPLDTSESTYKIIYVNSDSYYQYAVGDSILPIKMAFLNDEGVNSVFCNIIASDGTNLNSSPLILLDNGNGANGDNTANDNIYSALFPLSQVNPNGKYTINYFVTNAKGETKQAAVYNFEYNNGQDNVAPVLSNLQMPDEVVAGQTIIFSVDVSDSNGLNDIKAVYYEAFNPSGAKITNSQGISQFPLFDNGDTQNNGDVTSNDGTFTVGLTFPTTALKGTWRFEFRAQDRRNIFSEKIAHNFEVK